MASCVLTGDHTEIHAVSKQMDRQKQFSELPLSTQELLVPKPRFFDGSNENPEDWLMKTKEFATFNQMDLSFAFDMVLRKDARQLWSEIIHHEESGKSVDVENWFMEKFITPKTLPEKLSDLITLKQKPEEKYRSFELRVKKMVKEIFENPLPQEEITNIFVLQGLRSEKLRESFALHPEMLEEKRREMATNLEKYNIPRSIKTVEKTYAAVVNSGTFPQNTRRNASQSNFQHHRQQIVSRSSQRVAVADEDYQRMKPIHKQMVLFLLQPWLALLHILSLKRNISLTLGANLNWLVPDPSSNNILVIS